MSNYEQESKAVSYFLRHGAEKAGLAITKDGYVHTTALIEKMNVKFPNFNKQILEQIVTEDEKGRYSFFKETTMIRANQGHSIKVDLKFTKKIPPPILYHGTSQDKMYLIYKTGIKAMKRHHVHLTDDVTTAASVGLRHGSEVIIVINTSNMVKDGVEFFLSDNGVWLTEFVDPKYLEKK